MILLNLFNPISTWEEASLQGEEAYRTKTDEEKSSEVVQETTNRAGKQKLI